MADVPKIEPSEIAGIGYPPFGKSVKGGKSDKKEWAGPDPKYGRHLIRQFNLPTKISTLIRRPATAGQRKSQHVNGGRGVQSKSPFLHDGGAELHRIMFYGSLPLSTTVK